MIAAAMEECCNRAFRALLSCSTRIDGPAIRPQHHAVIKLRTCPADKTIEHIIEHALGFAIEGMAEPAAAARLDAQDVAAPNDIAVAEWFDDPAHRTARD